MSRQVSVDIDVAAELWSQGRTATQIAKVLGVTRNSVIGYANRNRDRFVRRKGTPEVAAAQEERLQKLEKLWAQGLTYRQMADELGTENVSVLVSSNRERFPARQRVKKEKPKPEPEIVAEPEVVEVIEEAPVLPTRKEAFMPLPGITPLLLWQAPSKACRWPVDVEAEGFAHHVCGATATHGSYCRVHRMLSNGPGTLSEQKAHKTLMKCGAAA